MFDIELAAVTGAASPASPTSPCTKVCRINATSGFCEGCWRTLAEIGAWSQLDDAAKREVCDQLAQRSLTVLHPKP